MPQQMMQQPTVVVVNNNSGPPPAEVACCCCLPMSCGIYAVAFFCLFNFAFFYGSVMIGVAMAENNVPEAGIVWIIVTAVAYIPQIVFFVFLVQGMMAGDHTSAGRHKFRRAMGMLLLSYGLNMLAWPVLGLIFLEGAGFVLSLPFVIGFGVNCCFCAW